MSVAVRIHGGDFLVEASDQMKPDDAVVLTHPS